MQRQLTTIEAGFYPDLLQRLIDCTISASNNAAAAVPYLVAALAALAVQWMDWVNPVDTLCECLRNRHPISSLPPFVMACVYHGLILLHCIHHNMPEGM